MQSLRGELIRAKSLITDLLQEPHGTPAEQLILLTKVIALLARLQQVCLDAMARQLERLGR
jgi:hypothetical protein